MRFTIRTQDESLKQILNVPYATGRPVRWSSRLSELIFDFVCRAVVKYHKAPAVPRVRVDGEETTDIGDSLSVWNVGNTHVTEEEISFVHGCTECDEKNKLVID